MVQVSPDLSQGNLEKCLQGYERYELLPVECVKVC